MKPQQFGFTFYFCVNMRTSSTTIKMSFNLHIFQTLKIIRKP